MQFKNFFSEPLHLEVQFEALFAGICFGRFFGFIEGINPRFRFSCACLGLPAHPFQFFAVEIIGFVDGRISVFFTDHFVFQIGSIATVVEVEAAVFHFPDNFAYGIQKIAVVGYQQQSDFGFGKIIFEPFYHFHIEVVGGLVHNQQGMPVFCLGFGKEFCQRHTLDLSAGQSSHFCGEIRNFQLCKKLFHLIFQIPGFLDFHFGNGFLHLVRILRDERMMVFFKRKNRRRI